MANLVTRAKLVMNSIRKEGIDAGLFECHTVSGEITGRTFLFLLVLPLGKKAHVKWLQMLEAARYAGSLVISTPNFHAAEVAICSGQIDAILMWDADLSEKRYVIERAKQLAAESGTPESPFFVFEDPLYPEWARAPLTQFLNEHCLLC